MRTNGVMDSSSAGNSVNNVKINMIVTDVESPRTVRPGNCKIGPCAAANAPIIGALLGHRFDDTDLLPRLALSHSTIRPSGPAKKVLAASHRSNISASPTPLRQSAGAHQAPASHKPSNSLSGESHESNESRPILCR